MPRSGTQLRNRQTRALVYLQRRDFRGQPAFDYWFKPNRRPWNYVGYFAADRIWNIVGGGAIQVGNRIKLTLRTGFDGQVRQVQTIVPFVRVRNANWQRQS